MDVLVGENVVCSKFSHQSLTKNEEDEKENKNIEEKEIMIGGGEIISNEDEKENKYIEEKEIMIGGGEIISNEEKNYNNANNENLNNHNLNDIHIFPPNPPVRKSNEEEEEEDKKTPTFTQEELRSNLNPNNNNENEKESEIINTDTRPAEIYKALKEDYIANYGQSVGPTLVEKLTSNNENKSVDNNLPCGFDNETKDFYINLFRKNSDNTHNKNIGDIDLMIEQKENKLNLMSFPKEPLTIRFPYDVNNSTNEIIHLRRYLIVNTQDNNDIRTIIELTTYCSSYSPYSEIINFTKRGTISQVITLYLNKNEIEDDDIKFNWEYFVVDNKQISQQFEKKGIKRSKSDNFKDNNSLNKNTSDMQVGNTYNNDNNLNEGGFEVDCPACGSKNMVSENATEFICKNCKSFLLQ